MLLKINDKYTIELQDNPFVFRALRYGEDWRSLMGDNLVLAMAYRIMELEEMLEKLEYCASEDDYDEDYDGNMVCCGTLSVCPICGVSEYSSHSSYCELDKLMINKKRA